MTIHLTKFAFVLILVGSLTACANSPFYHTNFMRGQVMSVDDQTAVICIGNAGASIEGQIFDVYRAVYEASVFEGDDGYRYYRVGELLGGTSIDGHFAQGTLISGEIKKHDSIEPKRRDSAPRAF